MIFWQNEFWLKKTIKSSVSNAEFEINTEVHDNLGGIDSWYRYFSALKSIVYDDLDESSEEQLNTEYTIKYSDNYVGLPVSDISTGTWTTTPLYQKIDDVVISDADFITCSGIKTADTANVLLSNLANPNTNINHTFT